MTASILHRILLATVSAACVALTGCASLSTLDTQVATYGEWPAGRTAGTYRFERLPSQATRPQAQERLEAAAAPALAAAGFQPAPAGATPTVVVQVAARESRHDALWIGGGVGWWRGGGPGWRYNPAFSTVYGPFWGPRWSPFALDDRSRVEREVALLIRDGSTGTPLYEARAGSDGNRSADAAILQAMFGAALQGFPQTDPKPHEVAVPITR